MLCCFSLFKRETVLRTIKCHFFPDENYEGKTFVVKSFGELFRILFIYFLLMARK